MGKKHGDKKRVSDYVEINMDTSWTKFKITEPFLAKPKLNVPVILMDYEYKYFHALENKLVGSGSFINPDLVVRRLDSDHGITSIIDFSIDFKDLLDRLNCDLPIRPLNVNVISWISCTIFPAVRFYLPDYDDDFTIKDAVEVIAFTFVDVCGVDKI